MAATNGLEKFSHLEDKIYRTIELTKALRQEKDDLERQLASARNTTLAEVVRRAISVDKFIGEALQGGSKILVEKKGKTKELIIF